ncbi:hypothetical protein [Ornithinimicrobium faecis]|uniref:hypothetical protein n=1 Tax=Ornithinimicrobium faecis TaxID=2934158 RepID=UPI002118AFE0|nr:hypothetical protein [Ornithinimicrobium sp. HY1745]
MSDLQLEPTGATPAPHASGSAAWKVLAALLAIACAVLAFLLLRPAEEAEAEESPTATAESTGALACDVLGEVVAVPDDEMASDEAYVMQLRLSAAGVLGLMAEEQDASFENFAEHLQGPGQAQARSFSMDSPEFHEALDLARSTCSNRFPAEE